MSLATRVGSVLVGLVVFSGQVPAQVPEQHVHRSSGGAAPKLGTVAFANSGNSAAQEPFLRGLALLHSFEYDEAAEAFREAQQADATFAMAFWGEAITYSHLLWGEDDPDGARKALARLAPTSGQRLAKAGTPRERAFGVAVEALFDQADSATRVRGFVKAMRQASSDYANDLDAAAFTSLALMFAGEEGNLSADERAAAKADAIAFAERVFRADPQHPGGTHYLIHATDNPASARRGLDAARRYAEIAPDAEHALHMPSHIFLQLGMWDETVASNERAWAASRAEVVSRKLTNADLSFHALQWLQYGYLQQGRYDDARRLIQTARGVLSGVDLSGGHHVDARFALGWMEFVHAANTGDWSGQVCELSGQPVGPLRGTSGREQYLRATAVYQRVILTAKCDSPAAARKLAADMLAGSANEKPASASLAKADAHALVIGYLRGDDVPADALATVSSFADQALVGPPTTLRTNELLAEVELKRGRPTEAVALYTRALETTPNRAAALLGLARAKKAAGDTQGAGAAYKQLLSNWHRADADVAALKEARGES